MMNDNKEKFRQEECTRLVDWMINNPHYTYIILAVLDGDSIFNIGQAIQAVQTAAENGLYFLLPLLFRKISESAIGSQCLASVFMNQLSSYLDLNAFCTELVETLGKYQHEQFGD